MIGSDIPTAGPPEYDKAQLIKHALVENGVKLNVITGSPTLYIILGRGGRVAEADNIKLQHSLITVTYNCE